MRRSSKSRGTPAGALLAGGLNRAMFNPEPAPRYTHHGIIVEPIAGTLRHIAGGRCVDVLVKDPRSTLDSCTVNADDVIDQQGRRYRP